MRLGWKSITAVLLAASTLASVAQSRAGDASGPPTGLARLLVGERPRDSASEVEIANIMAESASMSEVSAHSEDLVKDIERGSATPAEGQNIPPFMREIATALRARARALVMMADDATFAQGEADLDRASQDLTRASEAVLAEHAGAQ